jgi:hypothetical protein
MRTVIIADGESVSINGLAVVILGSFAFGIPGAETIDQNAELCVAHKLPVDLEQFSHTDEETGAFVQYSKNEGARIETYPEAAEAVEADGIIIGSPEGEAERQQDTALVDPVADPEVPEGDAVVTESGEPTIDAIEGATSEPVEGESTFTERIEKHEAGEVPAE